MLRRVTFLPVFLILIHYNLAAGSVTMSGEAPGAAGSVTMSGEAPGAAGETIEVFKYSDLITDEQETLGYIIPDKDGYFSFEVSIEDREVLFLRYGVYDLFFHAVQDENYDLILPPFIAMSVADRNNPYFEHIGYQLRAGARHSLNNEIRDFDSVYHKVVDLITGDMFYRLQKANYDSLTGELSRARHITDNEYYNLYTNSEIFSIKVLSMRKNSLRDSAIEFLDREFDSRNIACARLVKELFGGSLSQMLSGSNSRELRGYINMASSIPGIKELVGGEYKITNNELLEYIIVFNLYNEYYSSSFSKDGIYKLLESLGRDATYRSVREISQRIVSKIARLRQGNKPPGFSLPDEEGKLISPDSLAGKHVILTFGESSSWQTLSEYSLLKSWHVQYGNDLDIVTILADKDFQGGVAKMKSAGFRWILLDGSRSEGLQRLYEVKFFPSFYLLNREGRIISAPAPFPSENLRNLLLEQFQRDLIENIRN